MTVHDNRTRERWLMAFIFLLALAVRLIYLTHLKETPFFATLTLDAEYHHQLAQKIAAGEWSGTEVFFRAPLYIYFLALMYAVLGENFIIIRVVQFIIGSFSCVLIYLIGRRLFQPWVALVAALMGCFYGLFIYFEGELLLTGLIVFFSLLSVLQLMRAADTMRLRGWLLSGIVLGLGAITRPNILLFAPFAALWIVFTYRNKRAAYRDALPAVLTFVLGAFLIIAPISLRNFLVGNDFVLVASQGGVNFFIGNNPKADGHTAIVPGTRPTWWGGYNDSIEIAERESGKMLKPSEISRFWYLKGLAFMKENPLKALKLLLTKFSFFWNGHEIKNNKDIYFFRKYSPLLGALLWHDGLKFPFGLIAPLAIVGMIGARKQWRRCLVLYLFILSYMLSVILFFVTARFRLPVIPFLLIFAAFSLTWAIEQFNKKKFNSLLGGILIFLISFMFVNHDHPPFKQLNHFQGHYDLGMIYQRLDQDDLALAEYQESIRQAPDFPFSHFNLGSIYLGKNQLDLAIDEFETVLRLNPDFPEAHHALAQAYLAKGKHALSRAHSELAKMKSANRP